MPASRPSSSARAAKAPTPKRSGSTANRWPSAGRSMQMWWSSFAVSGYNRLVPRLRLTHVYHAGVAAIGLLLLLQNTSPAGMAAQLGDIATFLLLTLAIKRAGFHV